MWKRKPLRAPHSSDNPSSYLAPALRNTPQRYRDLPFRVVCRFRTNRITGQIDFSAFARWRQSMLLQSPDRQNCEVRTSSPTVFTDLTPHFVSYARSAAVQRSSDGRRAYLISVTDDYPKNDERHEMLDERRGRSERVSCRENRSSFDWDAKKTIRWWRQSFQSETTR